MLESEFKKEFISRLKARLGPRPGLYFLRPEYPRSIPDLLILCGPRWAALEFKRSANATRRPNQEYHVELMDSMSYSRFVYPANSEEVINDLEELFAEPE